jgi:hypothetical protein
MQVKPSRAARVPRRSPAAALLAGTMLVATVGFAQAPDGAQTAPTKPTSLGNTVIAATWKMQGDVLSGLVVTDERNKAAIQVTDPFSVTLKDGSTIGTTDFRLQDGLREVELPLDPDASRLAEGVPGKAVEGTFLGPTGNLRLHWKLVQREGSNYLRESVTITAVNGDAPISRVSLFGADAADAIVDGSVDGSPVVSHDDWLGFEHPMSKADAWRGKVKLWIERTLPLAKGQSVTYSAVIGVARPGQLRRDFANYIERERAHPYRPFLHYNSWYDIGYFTPYTEAEALDRINAFGRQLVEKRDVKMDSFLFDDGWDDNRTLWKFNNGIPDGFAPLKKEAEKIN